MQGRVLASSSSAVGEMNRYRNRYHRVTYGLYARMLDRVGRIELGGDRAPWGHREQTGGCQGGGG